MTGLTRAQVEAFERDGVLAPLPLLDAHELARYLSAMDDLRADHGEIERIDRLHEHYAWARELGSHPRLLDQVESVIGADLLIHGTLMLRKRPGHPGHVPWHQDSVYSGWHLSPSVSAWIALTPSTEHNGCMRVIVGSHREGMRDHQERPGASVLLKRGETIRGEVDESRARSLALRPGQMSLHHCNVIHGSEANRSGQARVGFIVRFVTSAYRHGRGPMLRVRGQGDDGHLDLIQTPPPR